MAVAVYATDLADITLAETGTFIELSGWADGTLSSGFETDYFIQGTTCKSSSVKTTQNSIAFNASSISLDYDGAVLTWGVLFAPNSLGTIAQGGLRVAIGNNTSTFKMFYVGGSDSPPNPYGGWKNFAVNPRFEIADMTCSVVASTGTVTRSSGNFLTDGVAVGHTFYFYGFASAGNNGYFTIAAVTATTVTVTDNTGMVNVTDDLGVYFILMDAYTASPFPGLAINYYGIACYLPSTYPSKGSPFGLDAIRYGRCEMRVNAGDSGTPANFTDMAAKNDANDATNGYNRWGLFSAQGGAFIWKGLLTLGYSSAVYFEDSNKVIFVDSVIHVKNFFNTISIEQAGSTVNLTNCVFASLSSISKGILTMAAAADVNIEACLFKDMATFTFLSSAAVLNTTFVRCELVDSGGASFLGSKILESSVVADASAFEWDSSTDPDGYMDDMEFSEGANAHHAIEFGTTSPTTINLNGITFTGFATTNGQNNSTFYIARTSGTVTINTSGCSGNLTYKTAGATVTINQDQVNHKLTGLINGSEVTYMKRGTAVDTGSDGSTTTNSRSFVTTNSWTPDAYKGHLLYITSGSDAGRYYVSGNSATTLYLDTEMTATGSSLTWELYDENDDTEVFHVESVTGNQSQYTYTYGGDVDVDITIISTDYEQVVLEDVTLGNSSQSIPISQIFDNNYYNPNP